MRGERTLVSRLVSKARPTSQKASTTMTKGGLTRGSMVELRGLEPLTSSMPWKRATNCAKAPGRAGDLLVYNLTDPTVEAQDW
jgi:hypothetical protein